MDERKISAGSSRAHRSASLNIISRTARKSWNFPDSVGWIRQETVSPISICLCGMSFSRMERYSVRQYFTWRQRILRFAAISNWCSRLIFPRSMTAGLRILPKNSERKSLPRTSESCRRISGLSADVQIHPPCRGIFRPQEYQIRNRNGSGTTGSSAAPTQ